MKVSESVLSLDAPYKQFIILFYTEYLRRGLNSPVGVIHLVRMHKGGGGPSKSVRHVYKGRGAYTWKYVRKNAPFLHVFCDSFICWKLLPYFVVFGVDFHYCCIKHLLRLFSCLSNAF